MTQPSSTREASKGMTDTTDPAVTHLSEAERITRLETEFKYLAKESSVVAVRNDIEKLETALTSHGERTSKLEESLKKEIADQGKSLRKEIADQGKSLREEISDQGDSMKKDIATREERLQNAISASADNLRLELFAKIDASRNWLIAVIIGAIITAWFKP